MSLPEREASNKAAASYISKRTGFTREEIIKVLVLYQEYIIVRLLKHGKVIIPNVLTLYTRLRLGEYSIVPCITERLKEWYRKKVKGEILLIESEEEKKELIYNKEKSIKYRELASKYISNIRNAGFEREVWSNYSRGDISFLSFLRYLQQDFPYRRDWYDECSNESIKHIYIKKILELYKKKYPKHFLYLEYLWLGVGRRKSLMLKNKILAGELLLNWEIIVDIVVLIIRFPEFCPEFIRELVTEFKKFRIEEQERNGLLSRARIHPSVIESRKK